jgi:hypothetical protein
MGRRPLIGTALLEDYHLSIDFCEGGTVLVDEILYSCFNRTVKSKERLETGEERYNLLNE